MPQATVQNPNDFKVVKFTNRNDFGFTPDMGCMYDGRPIFGVTGAPGINGGESIVLPYHIAQRLATNLAKIVQIRRAPTVDPAGIPTGVPLWSVEDLDRLKQSYLEEMYSEERPIAQTETDRLMAKVEEYKKMVDLLIAKDSGAKEVVTGTPSVIEDKKEDIQTPLAPAPSSFADKKEVIAELEKRGINHDKRQSKAALEALIV